MKIKNLKSPKLGFTLLETIMAVVILAMAIVGPLELAARSIGYTRFSQHQIVAFYLAQEGVEIVRQIRDSNMLATNPWLSGLAPCINQFCIIEFKTHGNPNKINACGGQCPFLEYQESSGEYGYFSPAEPKTIFVRSIQIIDLSPAEEIKIEVKVDWKETIGQKTFTVQDNLLKWKNY